MSTRAELKQRAKDAMKAQKPSPVLTTFIYLAIAFVLSFFSSLLSFTVLIPLLVSAVAAVLQCGYTYYCMKVSRGKECTYNDLFYGLDSFQHALKLIGLVIVIGVFTFLWSLLLVIPGIIKALSYSQAIMLSLENPDMSIMDAIRESQKLMNGHKAEFFVLQLSFILWGLLVSITLGIASVWVVPYMNVTLANYYYELKGEADSYGPESIRIEY